MTLKKEKPKNRTVYYFRCEFAKIEGAAVKDTLETMTKSAWLKLNSTEERTFYIGEERSVVGMKLSSRKAKLSYGNRDCTLFSVGLYEVSINHQKQVQSLKLVLMMLLLIKSFSMVKDSFVFLVIT
ncbi:hypothetical protein [Shewanella baltica]|uniref:hypothetical protein n=1 Tax=Shewanella baltica TaxID=62322 RepID=UPI000E079F9D|nr:hypothetical protein [Shewanella baltica]SUI42674.1 Uncharacterised protein [Shewanella baltica]